MAKRVYLIPTPDQDAPIATQSTTLSGSTYRMNFRYNERRELWELSLFTDDGTPIVQGVALVHGWDLLLEVSNPNRPPGALLLYASDGRPATLESLGSDRLYYIVDEDADGEP